MKYRLLLSGRNNTIIDDFFFQLDEVFESITSSERYEDILTHVRLFEPAAFCFCIASEPREVITRMIKARIEMGKKDIPFILIGTEEECADFKAIAPNTADLVLTKPLSAIAIQSAILEFLDEKARKAEEAEQIKRQLEEMKRQKELASIKKHILVVDDDPMMLKIIKEYLHDEYEVATAVSGRIALKFLEKKKTDLILLDYEMPIEDGPAVLEKVRANEALVDIPVVFLTGITDSNKIKKVLVMKPQGYLLKPVDRNKLMETLDSIFGKKEV